MSEQTVPKLKEGENVIVYRCEDSPESVFTAVYRAYEEKRCHENTRIVLDGEPLLFAENVPVETDPKRAGKVIRTLGRRFGEEDFGKLCDALASECPDKAQAVYQVIVKGLRGGCRPGHLFDNLVDDDCCLAFSLARAVGREKHHLLGFLRFREMEQGILYSEIGPKNQVLPFLMAHFADRLPGENFLIHDDKRELYGVHPAGKEWFLVRGDVLGKNIGRLKESGEERAIQELFRHFCREIAVKERKNIKLQRNLLPLRFQEYMTEFVGK